MLEAHRFHFSSCSVDGLKDGENPAAQFKGGLLLA